MSFSYSQLSLYRTCPKQYEFANVKKIPRQISAGESFGASVHGALAKWGRLEVGNRELGKSGTGDQLHLFSENISAADQVLTLEIMLSFWHQSFIVEGYVSKTDADMARKRGEKIMRYFFEWWSREKREVVAVERGFSLKLAEGTEGIDGTTVHTSSVPFVTSAPSVLTGRFDRVEKVAGGVRIIDYKTTAPREQEDVDTDLQLSIYALAAETMFGVSCVELLLLFLRENGITEVISKRSPTDLTSARSVIKTLADGISRKDFHPDPDAVKCGRCPYRGICPASAV